MYDKNVFMQLYFSIFCKWSGAIFVRMDEIFIDKISIFHEIAKNFTYSQKL